MTQTREPRTADDDAYTTLSAYWPQDHQGRVQLPVDPFAIARDMGLVVLRMALPTEISGMLRKQAGHDAEIFINHGDAPVRQRFTCAHELGHYVSRSFSIPQTDAAPESSTFEYVDRRDTLSSKGTYVEERYANAFAAQLLMPDVEVRAAHEAGQGQIHLARVFDVSLEAMGHRLDNLRLPRG